MRLHKLLIVAGLATQLPSARTHDQIDGFVLLGERNTGVGWLSALIHMNAPAYEIREPFWRHDAVSKEMLSFPKENSTIFVLLTKDPWGWLVSMRERAPDYVTGSLTSHVEKVEGPSNGRKSRKNRRKRRTQGEALLRFVKTEWRADVPWREGIIKERFKNVVAMRTKKLESVFDSVDRKPAIRFSVLRYEDLLQDAPDTLANLFAQHGLPVPWGEAEYFVERKAQQLEWHDRDEPGQKAFQRRSYYIHRRYMKKYSADALRAAAMYLNTSLEMRLGYQVQATKQAGALAWIREVLVTLVPNAVVVVLLALVFGVSLGMAIMFTFEGQEQQNVPPELRVSDAGDSGASLQDPSNQMPVPAPLPSSLNLRQLDSPLPQMERPQTHARRDPPDFHAHHFADSADGDDDGDGRAHMQKLRDGFGTTYRRRARRPAGAK